MVVDLKKIVKTGVIKSKIGEKWWEIGEKWKKMGVFPY